MTTTGNSTRELECQLRAFESFGIFDREITLFDQFKNNILFKDGRYDTPTMEEFL
jgi:hypothetical protein